MLIHCLIEVPVLLAPWELSVGIRNILVKCDRETVVINLLSLRIILNMRVVLCGAPRIKPCVCLVSIRCLVLVLLLIAILIINLHNIYANHRRLSPIWKSNLPLYVICLLGRAGLHLTFSVFILIRCNHLLRVYICLIAQIYLYTITQSWLRAFPNLRSSN